MALKPQPRLFWEDVQKQYTLDLAVAEIQKSYHLKKHPYFMWIQDPKLSQNAFRRSQVPFRFVTESHAQALAAVMAHIPHVELRLALAQNMAEEHGMGKMGGTSKGRFVDYLHDLGVTKKELSHPCPIEVRGFAQCILNFALVNPYEAGAAMVGMIEYLYVGVSLMTNDVITKRGWLPDGTNGHYALHKGGDLDHAMALLDLAKPGWAAPRTRDAIAHGLLLAAHWLWSLYMDLLPKPSVKPSKTQGNIKATGPIRTARETAVMEALGSEDVTLAGHEGMVIDFDD